MDDDFKTGKRETAFGLLALWALITLKLFLWDDAADVAGYEGVYGALSGLVGIVVTGLFAVKGYEVVSDRHNRRKFSNPRLPAEGEVPGAG